MADIDYCTACADLQETAPSVVANGIGDTECANLQENKGLSGESDNCTDLNLLNDCLIGSEIEAVETTDVCDWRDYMKGFGQNIWTVLKGIICSVCGLWSKISEISQDIQVASYIGMLTLYTTTRKEGDGSNAQSPAFNTNVRQGNMPETVLSVADDYKGIVVNNTTSVPILVETTFNCSLYTQQNLCCCYILVLRDDVAVGQTPFITPDTYDQQVMAEPFVLDPGETAEMRYVFRIGSKNSWFISQFGGTGGVNCVLDEVASTQQNQRSYFEVKVSSIVDYQS